MRTSHLRDSSGDASWAAGGRNELSELRRRVFYSRLVGGIGLQHGGIENARDGLRKFTLCR